jgi:Disulfide bond chaperones of the HSP33 family
VNKPVSNDDSTIEVRTYFVRGRNAMVARAEMSPLYVDYYLHLADSGLSIPEGASDLAKQALAAIALHCASRPRNEVIAWTVSFQDPLMNVFAAGDNPNGTLVANVFTEHVKHAEKNLFYADVVADAGGPRRSAVDFEGADIFRAAEQYYLRSEQRLARFFEHGDEDYVFVSAQPDCDEAWLRSLDNAAIRKLDQTETLVLLERRAYRFECGCNQDRMLRVLLPPFQRDPEGLFEGGQVVRIHCPRCGARHAITREALEAMDRLTSAAGGAA